MAERSFGSWFAASVALPAVDGRSWVFPVADDAAVVGVVLEMAHSVSAVRARPVET